MAEALDRELGWDDAIENDGGDFTLLPPGEYSFEVISFERARHNGSAKLPACNKAVLTLDLADGDGNSGRTQENLFLHSKTEGLLCQFFRSIGARKSGERLVMDWSSVPGATGRCKVTVRKYTGRDGEQRESNDVKFLDPPEGGQPQAAAPDNSGAQEIDVNGEIPF